MFNSNQYFNYFPILFLCFITTLIRSRITVLRNTSIRSKVCDTFFIGTPLSPGAEIQEASNIRLPSCLDLPEATLPLLPCCLPLLAATLLPAFPLLLAAAASMAGRNRLSSTARHTRRTRLERILQLCCVCCNLQRNTPM